LKIVANPVLKALAVETTISSAGEGFNPKTGII
jgi:hypothetical protein